MVLKHVEHSSFVLCVMCFDFVDIMFRIMNEYFDFDFDFRIRKNRIAL